MELLYSVYYTVHDGWCTWPTMVSESVLHQVLYAYPVDSIANIKAIIHDSVHVQLYEV